MANLTGAINAIRSTIPRAMKWAAESRSYQLAGRLAYAPRVGAVGAAGGMILGGATSHRDQYGESHRLRGALMGAGLGSTAGLRLLPRAGSTALALRRPVGPIYGGSVRAQTVTAGPRGLLGAGGGSKSGWWGRTWGGVKDYSRYWWNSRY